MDGLTEQALDRIDPELVWAPYAETGRKLLARFRAQGPPCNGYDSARRAAVTVWLEARREFGDEFSATWYPFDETWSVCERMLERAWGSVEDTLKGVANGSAAAFDQAVEELVLTMARYYAEEYLRSSVSIWLYRLSPDEQLAAPSAYLRRFGGFFPEVRTRGQACAFRSGFQRIDKQHAALVRRFTLDMNTGRRETAVRPGHEQE